MRIKKLLSALLSAAVAVSGFVLPAAAAEPVTAAEEYMAYKDESLSFEERAADLVSRMTLEEKVAQLGYTAPAIPRLGVSNYNYWKECLHGVARQGQATNFPASLALSNTWNRELIHKVADITSTEARAKNNRTNLSYYTPTINMARDPRWGRNEETYGEDPYLTGQLGGEFVKGMQGSDDKYIKIIATIKHFAANNNEAYRRGGSSVMNEFNYRNYYLKPFRNVTEIEMPGSVMSSYNAATIYRDGELLFNYKPSAANTYLLTDVLRRTWGFDGYVTTDCGAGEDLISNTSYMNGVLGTTTEESGAYIAAALKAGMDIECNLGGGNASVANGADAVLKGYITEKQLETSIYHLFLQRFRTGEFDSAPAYRDITSAVIETPEHIAAAEEAAEESWVLLKNDDNTLPLKNVTKAAVVGNMANTLALGDYTGSPKNTVKPITGMREALEAQGAEVNYLGAVDDGEKLFNVKSITLVMKDGSKKAVDLTKAENVSGMTLSDGSFLDVTPKAAAVIKNVSFLNVASIEAEISTGSRIGGSINIAYGSGGPTVAAISSGTDTDEYTVCSAPFTGEDGGYNGTADMYISASASVEDFSVESYKTQLDDADVIIAYAGTVPKQDGFGDPDSSESKDRSSINLPAHQSHVQAICDAYPEKTVVVMSTVGQINVEPFKDKCKAILWTSYNGQTQGTALGKILTGAVNPSGRLSTTWYKNDDVNKMELVNTANQTIGGISGKYTNYDIQPDGTRPGNTYQYYSGKPVYPFGYGMSYTSYEYSNITADKTAADANGTVTFTADVTNTGDTAGSEVVQLYISHPQDGNVLTPKKQLKGFEKISLAAGETKTVSFTLDVADMALYSEQAVKNVVPNGSYTAYIGKDSEDTTLSKTFDVSGTLDNSLMTVKAMPDGVSLNGYISEDGTKLSPVTAIKANVSAVMHDESVHDIRSGEISYTSSNEAVAKVDANGNVTSGNTNGTATITASVTVDGVTMSDSFPVANVLTVANDDIPYVIEKAISGNDGSIDVTLSYRGSTAPTEMTLKAEILNADGSVKKTAETAIKGEGKYTVAAGAADNETVRFTVYEGGTARSESFETVYVTPKPSKITAYYLESPDHDYTPLTGGTDGVQYTETVNGLCGYGSWSIKGSAAEYTYVDVNDNEYSYSFTQAWSAGQGGTNKRCLYFTPEAPCKVTAVFFGSEPARSMTIKQGSKQTVQEGTGAAVDFSLEVTDTTEPVYIYGGSSTKYLYAVIVEYYGMGDKDDDPTPTPTAQPGTEKTDIYKVQPGAYSAGDTLYDGEFTLKVTNDITAAEDTTEGFTNKLTFRTQLGGDIKSHVDDAVSHFSNAGIYNNAPVTSLILTPKHDGTAGIYLNNVSGDRTANIWDNTDNVNAQEVVSGSAMPMIFEVKAGHEYIIYGRKWTAAFLGAELTYTEQKETCVKIIAEYENGVMKSVDITKDFPVEDITAPDNSGSVKTFYWKSLESMEPISTAIAAAEEIELQSIEWGDVTVSLTDEGGVKSVWKVMPGGRADMTPNLFYSAPEGMATSYPEHYFDITALAVYKGRLYVACRGGYVIMMTDCAKCYKLFRPVEYDITGIEIKNGAMVINNGESIDMSELGGDTVEPDEAVLMINNGAAVIDMRDAADFEAGHFDGSQNASAETLEAVLSGYDKNTAILFVCYSGTRAGEAVKAAKALGYMNVYNAGAWNSI